MKRTIIFLLLLVLSFSGCTVKESVGMFSEDVFFRMSEKELINSKGEPLEKEESTVSPMLFLSYEENIGDYFAQTQYTFVKTTYKWELMEVSAAIPTPIEDRKQIFDDVYTKLKAHYKNKENFYNGGIQTNDDGTLTGSFGTNDGATGISVSVWCDEEYVRVLINNQF